MSSSSQRTVVIESGVEMTVVIESGVEMKLRGNGESISSRLKREVLQADELKGEEPFEEEEDMATAIPQARRTAKNYLLIFYVLLLLTSALMVKVIYYLAPL